MNGTINHTGNKCDPCSTPFMANRDSTMSFLNSFWFTLTAFFLQNSSINPKVLYEFIILLAQVRSHGVDDTKLDSSSHLLDSPQ